MRIVGLVFALLVTLSMSAAAQTHVPGYTGQDSTQVQGYRPSAPDPNPYNNFGYPGNTNPDTGQTATRSADPYLQRYYSESEGWTYYTLPKSSSERRSDGE